MAEVNITGTAFLDSYNQFISTFPGFFQTFINIFLLVLLITIYAMLVWKFYRFIGRKNILELNLGKYNTSEHPVFTRLLAGFLYFIEYIIVLPFLIFIWFAGFASFMILLSEGLEVQTVLFLSVTIIAAIRMTSYIPKNGEDIAQEVAKILPYTLLAVFVLNPNFFSFSRVLTDFGQLPNLFSQIFSYLLFIFILEIILRFFELVFDLAGIGDDVEEGQGQQKKR